jgi:serine protease Do
MRHFTNSRVLRLIVTALVVESSVALAQPRTTATISDVAGAIEGAARTAAPAVVEIFATSYVAGDGVVQRPSELVMTERASGSGVVVDPDGYIITNAHVVRGAREVRVELPPRITGQSILAPPRRATRAEVVGIDIETDVAVLKVPERALAFLPFGDSDTLRAGQLVLAIGSPMGLQNSVSLGVVSSVARQLAPESPMVYVQTDASINRGSSGGPLIDLGGRLVGINTLLLSQGGAYEGISFAAPINIVRAVYEQLRKDGRVRRGDIGIRAQTLTPLLASGLGLPRDFGVLLSDVRPESMAARAGLRLGDIVLTLDGKVMENGRQLQVGLYRHYVGDVVTLEILRDGVTSRVPVAIAERQDALAELSESIDPRQHLVARLGILGVDLDRRVAAMLPSVRVPAGVVVVTTARGGVDAREGGLEAGDIIYAVNRSAVTTLPQLRAQLDALKPGDAVVLSLNRRGELLFLAFTAD